jgi:hypothetical protein
MWFFMSVFPEDRSFCRSMQHDLCVGGSVGAGEIHADRDPEERNRRQRRAHFFIDVFATDTFGGNVSQYWSFCATVSGRAGLPASRCVQSRADSAFVVGYVVSQTDMPLTVAYVPESTAGTPVRQFASLKLRVITMRLVIKFGVDACEIQRLHGFFDRHVDRVGIDASRTRDCRQLNRRYRRNG